MGVGISAHRLAGNVARLGALGIISSVELRHHRPDLPDAIIIEHPRHAGGHLGATRPEEINDPRFDFDRVLTGIFDLMQESGLDQEKIPLIAAGSIRNPEQVRRLLALGATAARSVRHSTTTCYQDTQGDIPDLRGGDYTPHQRTARHPGSQQRRAIRCGVRPAGRGGCIIPPALYREYR